jgi:uncharacterized membrane protein
VNHYIIHLKKDIKKLTILLFVLLYEEYQKPRRMSSLQYLVLIHVLAAIIGVGPTFFMHVLFRKKQTVQELRSSLAIGKHLEMFPKIGGTIAVLTGILLTIIGNYGSFMTLWLIGSLVIYICVQVIVIGFGAPASKKLADLVFNPVNDGLVELAEEIKNALAKVNKIFYLASAFGLLLFIFMILKPTL